MNVLELMQRRASCRNFCRKPIPEELLDASISAPSSGGFQNYSIVQIQGPKAKGDLKECCRGQSLIEHVAVDLIYCIDLHRERNIAGAIDGIPDTNLDYMKLVLMTIDAAAAAQNFCIAAESEGLGTVYIGNILNQQERAARLLKLPEGVIPVIMVCCGWPAVEGTVSKKYPRSIMVHREQYEEKNLEELLTAFREKYQDWKMKPSEKLLRKIGETAERNFGPDFREKNRRAMLDRGEVDPLSFWYGYYYAGINGIMTQREHLAFLERQNMPFFQG